VDDAVVREHKLASGAGAFDIAVAGFHWIRAILLGAAFAFGLACLVWPASRTPRSRS
jgi:hypothetical protein